MISVGYAAVHGGHVAGLWYESPTFWVAMAFVVLAVFSARPAFRIITSRLDSYAAAVGGTLDNARSLREKARAMLAEEQQRQQDASKTAEEIVNTAREVAATMKTEAARALEDLVKQREQQALERLEQAEVAAVNNARDRIADAAITAIAAVLSQKIDLSENSALVDASIKTIEQRLH